MGWSDKGAWDREQRRKNDEEKQDRVNRPSGSWDWLEFWDRRKDSVAALELDSPAFSAEFIPFHKGSITLHRSAEFPQFQANSRVWTYTVLYNVKNGQTES